MDRACQLFIVIGAIVLFIMLIGESNRSRAPITPYAAPRQGGTCGAMRAQGVSEAATSAKRANSLGAGNRTERTQESQVSETETYLSIADPWMNDEVHACSEPEPTQDEAALKQDYTWTAAPEVDEKFEALAISDKAVMKSVNIKAANVDTGYEAPNYSKTLGMSNPLHSMYHKSGPKEVAFGKGCTWFQGTDSYYAARQRTAACDCQTQDCDSCDA